MQIHNLYIEKYGKLSDFELEFFKAPNFYNNNLSLSILVGENGTGKTSILKCISDIFTHRQSLTSKVELKYSLREDESFQIDNYETPRVLPKKVIVSSYSSFEQFKTPKKFTSSNRASINESSNTEYVYAGPKSWGNLSGLSTVFLPIIKNFIFTDFKKMFATQELLKEIGYVEPPLIELGSHRIAPALERKLINENFIKRVLENNSDFEELRRNLNVPNEYSLKFLVDIAMNMDNFNKRFQELFRVTNHKVRKKFLNIDILHNYPGSIEQWVKDIKLFEELGIRTINNLWFPKRHEIVPMSDFSSGELSLFFRFFKMIDAMEDEAIILIDEPETHLHPRWIQKYVQILNSVFGQYNCHIILSTHSPLIVSDVPKECIVGLRNIDGWIKQYVIRDKTLGSSYLEILKDVFNIHNQYGEFTNEIQERILSLIKTNRIEQAKELYNNLGDSELKFDLFLEMKRILKKRD